MKELLELLLAWGTGSFSTLHGTLFVDCLVLPKNKGNLHILYHCWMAWGIMCSWLCQNLISLMPVTWSLWQLCLSLVMFTHQSIFTNMIVRGINGHKCNCKYWTDFLWRDHFWTKLNIFLNIPMLFPKWIECVLSSLNNSVLKNGNLGSSSKSPKVSDFSVLFTLRLLSIPRPCNP